MAKESNVNLVLRQSFGKSLFPLPLQMHHEGKAMNLGNNQELGVK
jgi:hypothetical protein